MEMPLEIRTKRLLLSPPGISDVPQLVELANDPLITEMTLSIPPDYDEGNALDWLYHSRNQRKEGSAYVYAIRNGNDAKFMGGIGVHKNTKYGWAELGYWIGAPYRGKGYVSEALRAIIDTTFEHLDLRRIQAHYKNTNLASGRVMEKNGMTEEVVLEDYAVKDGEYHTVVQYRILRREWELKKLS